MAAGAAGRPQAGGGRVRRGHRRARDPRLRPAERRALPRRQRPRPPRPADQRRPTPDRIGGQRRGARLSGRSAAALRLRRPDADRRRDPPHLQPDDAGLEHRGDPPGQPAGRSRARRALRLGGDRPRRDGRRHRHGGRARIGPPPRHRAGAPPHAHRAHHRRRGVRADGRHRRDGRRRAAVEAQGLHQSRVDRIDRPGHPVRVRAEQRGADPRLGQRRAASARRVLRARDLQAPAQRHRLLDSEGGRHPGPEHGARRQQPRLPHVARHRRSRLRGHAAAHGRDSGHDPARHGCPRSPERRSRCPLRLGRRTHGDRAGRLAGPPPRHPRARARPLRLDPNRAAPRRRRRDPLRRDGAVGRAVGHRGGRRDGRRLVAAGRVERRASSLVCVADARRRADRRQRHPRPVAADAAGAGRAGTRALRPRAGQHLGRDAADLVRRSRRCSRSRRRWPRRCGP